MLVGSVKNTADLIQGYGEKFTHSVSKEKSFIVMGQDPGESKLSKVHCDVQLKRGKKKTVNINIAAAPFSLNF